MPAFKPGRLVVVTLYTEDVREMVHFYQEIVGLSLLPHHGHQPAFALGQGVHLVIAEGRPARSQNSEEPGFPAFALAVSDLDVAIKHLHEQGVELPWDVQTGRSSRWVVFRDPAGNLVEFAQFQ